MSDELDIINKEIAALEDKLSNFKDKYFAPLDQLIASCDQDEQAILEAANLAIQELRIAKSGAMTAKHGFEIELRDLENRLRALGVEKNQHLQALAAKAKLIDLASSLKEVMDALAWSDAMMDFQYEDILFALNVFNEGLSGVLNANDRGMGKTFETGAIIDLIRIMFFRKHGRLPRVLWLTKKGLVGQTYRELMRWNSDRKIVVLGMKKLVKGVAFDSLILGAKPEVRDMQINMAIEHNAMLLANYDSLNTNPRLIDVEYDVIIVDEVHKLKGGANCRQKYCKHEATSTNCGATGLWRKTKELVERPGTFFLPLSGTPIQNHPRDMWAYLHLFAPEKFPSPNRFEREYAYGYGEYDKNGKPLVKVDWERLINVMKGQVIRRRKDEVGMNLPDKIVEYIDDELSGEQLDIYQQMATKMIVNLESMGDKPLSVAYLLPQWNYLRQIAIWPGGVKWRIEDPETGAVEELHLPDTNSMKMEAAMELVEELTQEGEQVVIFSNFNKPLIELARRINAAEYDFNASGLTVSAEIFTGAQNSDGTGDNIQQRFQSGDTQVLCCNIEAGGEGLNLQKNPEQWAGGACHAIFLDLWWNPAKNVQAEDRLHRKGQTDPVIIHNISAINTIDELVAQYCARKQEMQDGIMESGEIRPAIEWAEIMKGMMG